MKQLRLLAVVLVGVTVLSGCASSRRVDGLSTLGGEAPSELVRHAQRELAVLCEDGDIPGATLSFVMADGRTGEVACGVSRKSTALPMEPSDRMLSGSIGKTYVSAVFLQLVEEGKIDLDDHVAPWFDGDPWFERVPNARDLTLRMLMRHTSGIRRHLFVPSMQEWLKAEPHKVWKPEEMLEAILDTEPLFPAGAGWSYADTNYIIIGMIIEKIAGRTYYDELEERILNPLGLSDTSPSNQPALRGLVSGYTSKEGLFGVPEEVAADGRYAVNPQFEWTGGGLISTSSDLARWAWLLYGGDVLKPETRIEMYEGVAMGPDSDSSPKYGLGVMMRSSDVGPVVGHSGRMPGFLSMMAYYPDYGVAVAVQINTDVGVSGLQLAALLDGVVRQIATAEGTNNAIGSSVAAKVQRLSGEIGH